MYTVESSGSCDVDCMGESEMRKAADVDERDTQERVGVHGCVSSEGPGIGESQSSSFAFRLFDCW